MDSVYTFLFVNEWPWWFSGPLIGLFVGFYVWSQKRLFGMSSNMETLLDLFPKTNGIPKINPPAGRPVFVIGVLAGALLEGFWGRGGNWQPTLGASYDALFALSLPATAVFLFFGGILVGFGARMAGGCPSGHGLSGLSTLSPGSFITVPMWFIAGSSVTFLLHALS